MCVTVNPSDSRDERVPFGSHQGLSRELAGKLHIFTSTPFVNCAYGVEGCEGRGEATRNRFEEDDEEQSRPNLREEFRVDQDRLRALHGNAVLSRNPIRFAAAI